MDTRHRLRYLLFLPNPKTRRAVFESWITGFGNGRQILKTSEI